MSTFESTAQSAAADPFAAAPGKKTSEYAATVFTQFLAAVVALVALFNPGFEIDETNQVVIVSAASGVFGFAQMVYAWTRAKVKVASAEATALVSAPPLTTVERADTVTNTPAINSPVGNPPAT